MAQTGFGEIASLLQNMKTIEVKVKQFSNFYLQYHEQSKVNVKLRESAEAYILEFTADSSFLLIQCRPKVLTCCRLLNMLLEIFVTSA